MGGMVDVSQKPEIFRSALARGKIFLNEESIRRIKEGRVEKGDPLEVARVAAILAAKKTPEIIPHCHPIPITHVGIEFRVEEDGVTVEARVTGVARTGVEMEALTAVSVALLTIWDMVKKYEKDERGQYPRTEIAGIRVVEKIKGGGV